MNFDRLNSYLISKRGTRQDFPFDPQTLVYKVGKRMFALIGLDDIPIRINLKCDPEHAEGLRAIYPSILPGYHMNKRHWNTVILDGTIPDEVLLEMADDSYNLVVRSMSRSERKNAGI